MKIASNHLISARKIVTRNFLISMRPIHIDSGIQQALAFDLLRFCWRLGFLTSSTAALGSSDGTHKATELTEDAQTTVETSTNFEWAREVFKGDFTQAVPEDYFSLKGFLSPKIDLKPKALGAA